MHLRLKKDVKIKRVRMVVPEIKAMNTTEPEERHLLASLGTLEKDKTTRYILDMSLPKAARRQVSASPTSRSPTKRAAASAKTTGQVPLEITYTSSGQGYVNAEVAKACGRDPDFGAERQSAEVD